MGLVERPHLVHKIENSFQQGSRVLLVSAPPGFGKTTVLCQWAASQYRYVAWLGLDDGDNDIVRFWSYFIASLQQRFPDIGDSVLASLGSAQPMPTSTIPGMLINEISTLDKPFVFVLDDYHLIRNQSIHEALTYLVENQPSLLYLVIVSRADPPMPLARWRSRRQLVELRAEDLRFSEQEASRLLTDDTGLEIPAEDLKVLEARTEGWAAGLHLASLAIRARMAHGEPSLAEISTYIHQFSGSNRYILDYLLGEVLDQQPEEIRKFLFQTSILQRLCAPLCDFVLEERDDKEGQSGVASGYLPTSQQMLDYLDRSNLFVVPLDDKRTWYRYHILFNDLLRQRAQASGQFAWVDLHKRAAMWYEQNDFFSDAIYHGLQAHSWESVSGLIEQNALGLLARGEVLTLLGWLDALPGEVVRSRPWLCVGYAWVLMLTGRFDKAAEYLSLSDQASKLRIIFVDDRYLMANINAIRASLTVYQGDVPGAISLAQEALALLPADELIVSSFVSFTLGGAYMMVDDLDGAQQAFTRASQTARQGGNIHLAAPSLRVIAQLMEARALLHQAEARCKEAIQLSTGKSGRISPAAADAHGKLSDLYYEWDEIHLALQFANTSVELGEQLGNVDVLVGAYSRLSRLEYSSGNLSACQRWLQKVRDLMFHSQITPGSDSLMQDTQVRMWIDLDDMTAIRDWVQRSAESSLQPVNLVNESGLRTLARAYSALGEQDTALDLLQHLDEWAVRKNLPGVRIKNLVALAAINYSAGDRDQAASAMEIALPLAEPSGYIRTFVDQVPQILPLLVGLRPSSVGISREYLSKLVGAFSADKADSDTAASRPADNALSSLIEPLSERELEVLALVAAGLSNQEVAEQLYISLGTVKAHTANVYRKLDVTSRTQAVAVARELKLI